MAREARAKRLEPTDEAGIIVSKIAMVERCAPCSCGGAQRCGWRTCVRRSRPMARSLSLPSRFRTD